MAGATGGLTSNTMPDDDQANAPSDVSRVQPEAGDELDTILNRVKWVGPGPEPSEDEVMDLVNDEIHDLRAERNEDAVR